jgi:hypothetical protein
MIPILRFLQRPILHVTSISEILAINLKFKDYVPKG